MPTPNQLHLFPAMAELSQPCSFKEMWFTDIPFTISTDSGATSLAMNERSALSIYTFLKRRLIDMLLMRFNLILLLRFNSTTFPMLRSLYDRRTSLVLSVKARMISKQQKRKSSLKKPPVANLKDLPLEIRFRIFGFLAEDTKMKVVGHHSDGHDAFYFKDRGFMPILVTCKQFYEELLGEYFRHVPVEIKSSCPSMFSGDMSGFGCEDFRARIRNLRIKDNDYERRLRIGAAFSHANIEYTEKGALGSRKGAYYFSALPSQPYSRLR